MHFRRQAAFGIAFLLALSSCIKREPKDAGTSAVAPGGAPRLDEAARKPLLGPGGLHEFELHGEQMAHAEISMKPVEGQPFNEALHANVKEASGSTWSVQVQAKIKNPVEQGDAILATFYIRSVTPQSDGKAETEFVFERAGGPYTKSISYPVYLFPEWRKVQVRFTAKESYAAGEAQMIFRLGYEPQQIQIGGVTVENFGKIKVRQLPSTEVADMKMKPKPVKEAPLPPIDGGELAVDVSAGKVIGKISPYVYGINSQKLADTGATLRRMGGNRQTVYNWELNASNAGSDYRHQNDDWPCSNLGYKTCDKPAAQFIEFVKENAKAGIESLAVVPLVDYVSADKAGPVSEKDKAPSPRFLKSLPVKPKPYADRPDLSDGVVYQDEFIHFMTRALGGAGKGGPRFWALDNEPALWPSTHPRIHPDRPTYKEIVTRTEAMAQQIVKIDPGAVVLGGVMFGWSEYMSLTSAPDSEEYNKKYGTYLDYFLASLKELEQKHGKRLVHALDVHWYPEMRGSARITEDDASYKTIAARLQAPRSLWDPTFTEKSWIGEQWKKPIQLIRWLKERIAARYPGTEVAMTEYSFGAADHLSGGLAQADVLGILGREGVYVANYWGSGAGVGDMPKYVAGAFRLFRNYDGKGGTFGDTALEAKTADPDMVTVYAAKRSAGGALTIVMINKDLQKNYSGKIKIDGGTCASADAYRLDEKSPAPQKLPSVKAQGNVIAQPLPRLSATILVCK